MKKLFHLIYIFNTIKGFEKSYRKEIYKGETS